LGAEGHCSCLVQNWMEGSLHCKVRCHYMLLWVNYTNETCKLFLHYRNQKLGQFLAIFAVWPIHFVWGRISVTSNCSVRCSFVKSTLSLRMFPLVSYLHTPFSWATQHTTVCLDMIPLNHIDNLAKISAIFKMHVLICKTLWTISINQITSSYNLFSDQLWNSVLYWGLACYVHTVLYTV